MLQLLQQQGPLRHGKRHSQQQEMVPSAVAPLERQEELVVVHS
jgi:hypothetical protein